MISDNDAHSADALYDQHYHNKLTRDYKPGGSNRENKDSLEKATSCFLLRDLLIEINMHEKYGYEVEITRTKDLKKLITETFPEEITVIPA